MTEDQIFNEINIIMKNDNKLNSIDAFLYFCEKNKYDIEMISNLIPQSLKTKIFEDAAKLKLIKKKYCQEILSI